jgi:hypothetical protein
MTIGTLDVSGIFGAHHLRVFNIRFVVTIQAKADHLLAFSRLLMTIPAGDQRRFIVRWVVMAVSARNTITGISSVGLVIEPNLTGNGLIDNPDGLLQRFGGKSGISVASYPHNEQSDCDATSDSKLSI